MSLMESGEDIRAITARNKASRQRLNALRVNRVPVPGPVVKRESPVDLLAPYRPIIGIVADASGIPTKDLIDGYTSKIEEVRRIAMAVCVRWLPAKPYNVALAFKAHPEVVWEALRVVDRTLNRYVLTRSIPLDICLPTILRCLEIDKAAHSDDYRPSVAEIIDLVCIEFGVGKTDLLSQRRTRPLVMPRQIAMGLAKRLTFLSLPEIGRRFAGRDHTTVLHAARRCEPLMAAVEREIGENPSLGDWVRALKAKVGVVPFAPNVRYLAAKARAA